MSKIITSTVSFATSNWKFFLLGLLQILIIAFALYPQAGILVLAALAGMGLCLFIAQKPHFLFYMVGFFISYQTGFSAKALFGINVTPLLVLSLLALFIILFQILTTLRFIVIPYFAWWLAFTGLAVITYAQSPSAIGYFQSIWFVFRMAIVFNLIYPAFCWFLTKKENIHTLFVIMAISAAISGLIAVIQTTSGGNLLSGIMTNGRFLGFLWKFPSEVLDQNPLLVRSSSYVNNFFRGHGTFYTGNYFGAFLSIIIGLTWGLFRRERGRRQFLFALILGAQLVGVIVTFSRTAWLATSASLIIAIIIEIYFWGDGSVSRWLQMQLMAIVSFFGMTYLGIILFPSEIINRFATLLSPGQILELQWRIDVWNITFQSIIDYPWFGTGIFTPIINDPLFGIGSFSAHNLFLGLAYERGIPALCIFLFFMWRFFKSTWTWMKNEPTLSEKALATGVFAAGIAFLVSGMGSAILGIENILMLFWILMAVASISRNKLPQSSSGHKIIPKA